MEVLISQSHLSILSRALQCLCRIATSVVIELSSAGAVHWRALNDSQTTFASLRLNSTFFLAPVAPVKPIRCRLLSRNLIWSLRPRLAASKANVKIELGTDALVFEVKEENGLGQRIQICSEDIQGSIYSHSCDKSSASNCVVVNSKWFLKQLEAFHPLLKEITLQALPDYMLLRSFTEQDDIDDEIATLDTEIRLRADDFEAYNIAEVASSSVTFALKDLKTMLRFCETAETNLHLFFSGAGRPLIMSSSDVNDLNNPWTLNIVVATFSADDESVGYRDDNREALNSQISNARSNSTTNRSAVDPEQSGEDNISSDSPKRRRRSS